MDKKLLLFIRDMKAFYLLSRKLKEKRLIWSSLESEASLPLKNSLIVTDAEGKKVIQHTKNYRNCKSLYSIIDYTRYSSFTSLILNVLRELYGIHKFTTLLVALDPGQKNIGIAYFLDQTLIFTEIVHSAEKVIERINICAESFWSNDIEVKVGKGSLRSLRTMLRVLTAKDATLLRPLHIFLVDESGSSKQNGIHIQNIKAFYPGYKKSITRDEQAAIIIGYRHGKELTDSDLKQLFSKEAHISELKHIQRASRKKSQGKLSLSRDLANEVYNGNLTLEKAIMLQERKKECKEKNSISQDESK
ncbi:MAG: hypothetical protein JW776_14785 [Candidatus Lokiarchaeota archaeon]|nr:hypothetical protein [Candidatus Lokiarchaeota archaeon]